jgi:hypothetical protein
MRTDDQYELSCSRAAKISATKPTAVRAAEKRQRLLIMASELSRMSRLSGCI